MTDYNKLTVAKLRDLLKERGILPKGLSKKAQIVQRLEQHDAEQTAIADEQEPAQEVEESVPAPVKEAQTKSPTQEQAPAKEPTPLPETIDVTDKVQTLAIPSTEIDAEVALVAIPTQASATDTAVSSQLNSDVESSKKRKRRSASPSLETQDVSKKAKFFQKHVHLKEDENTHLAQAPASADQHIEPKQESLPPKVTGPEPVPEEQIINEEEKPEADVQVSKQPSIHSPTRALYIRNFARPLQPTALHNHLISIASPKNPSPDAISTFYLDSIRTHAFIVFASEMQAARVRNVMHDSVWPAEKNRRPLWADYMPVELVSQFIETEKHAEGGLKRWEVEYIINGDSVHLELLEDGRKPKPVRLPRPTEASSVTALGRQVPEVRPSERQLQEARPSDRQLTQQSFTTLSSLFKNTTTKPMLYYQPVSEDLVTSRKEELRYATSKRWPHSERDRPPPRGPGRQEDPEVVHRYTFEEGDRLLDGGVHRFGAEARGREGARLGGGALNRGVPMGPRGRGGYGGYGGRRGGGWR
jgi:hypothetical protein